MFTIIFCSNDYGFWTALSKFAGCLGAATCSWLLASAIVLPSILISRGRIKRSRSTLSDRTYGEFTILGEEGRNNLSDELSNGRIRSRIPKTHYVRLGEPGEMHSLSGSRSVPESDV
jgi:hypothetical protein